MRHRMPPIRAEQAAFSSRLSDLLGTLESGAIIGLARSRVRGLGEQLRFACLALGCTEALVALEMTAMDRLVIPAVADASGFREVHHELIPDGTPIAYLLAGGAGHSVELHPDDAAIKPFAAVLAHPAKGAIFSPLRMADRFAGAAILLSADGPPTDSQLEMSERLAEVLALTVESFFTERALFELFALALPDLLGPSAPTTLPKALEDHIRGLRVAPAYRRRLSLATAVGRLAGRTDAETDLAGSVLAAFDAYLGALERSIG
jgi:hypothetical protein